MERSVMIGYTNWKGVTSDRHIEPVELFFGSTEFHPTEQWLLRAWDKDKNAERVFAMADINSWNEG